MLTYNLMEIEGSLYENLYRLIKEDIYSGKLKPNEKMPSKRMFATNLGVSTITVENAYEQLISEGYIYSKPKVGYFVSEISNIPKAKTQEKISLNIDTGNKEEDIFFDFSTNRIDAENFPFSIWAKILRDLISNHESDLMEMSPSTGIRKLREAIAEHLYSFRGMSVDPDQIIVGAGTEYLYGLLIKLLGKDRLYCVENPGYKKLFDIYKSYGVKCRLANVDSDGLMVSELRKTGAEIAHTSPNHHFPTGISMPIKRRYELLAWAGEKEERYIIEDDYDSEFRLNGKPIAPLQSIDENEKVIYMNTFSKTLASTIRISYMVLPPHLAKQYFEKLSFYSCTVSTFEQHTLATFIREGYLEKHINRMRLYYGKKRARVLELLKSTLDGECRVIENDSGLHFLMELKTDLSDEVIKEKLRKKGIKIVAVTDYDMSGKAKDNHRFILNYTNIDEGKLAEALNIVKQIMDNA